MLDELYGLLEPVESAALAAHIATCPDCAAAMDRARSEQDLIQKASTLSFPALQFTAPTEGATAEVEPPPVPSEYAGPRVITPRYHWVRWAVVAGILLVASGTIGPSIRKLSNDLSLSNEFQLAQQSRKKVHEKYEGLKAEFAAAKVQADQQVATAKSQHDDVLQNWVTARQTAERSLPFSVTVRGPAAAIPGAPNDYAIAAINDRDTLIAAQVVASLVGRDGKEYFQRTLETPAGRESNLRIPASVWQDVPANESLTLRVHATNPITKQTSDISEPLKMMDAAYSTVLTTDSPLYRPGDTIRFRSLTLDRTRFQPPSRDLKLAYALIGPDHQIVKGLGLAGTTHLESLSTESGTATLRPLIGPDGKPVRGIGCGELALPSSLPNGAYQLAVYELPSQWTAATPPSQAKPLATRPIRIQSYTTHKWLKTLTFDKVTYGPGDAVVAKLTVTNQGKPVANTVLMVDATADNQPVISLNVPPTTDPSGQATIRFTLPKKAEIKQAVLRVTLLNEALSESIVRPIPLVSRSMTVEFFPEGGDLVAGVPNRVYVRGRMQNGKPADFAGTISDGTQTVATVESEADADAPGVNRGIGVFTLTPQAGKSYTLNLNRPFGLTTTSANLPAVKADGVVLSIPQGVVESGEPIVANLYSTQPRKLVIGAYSRGTPVAHASVTIEAGKLTPVTLTPHASAPGGVTRVTVFEEPSEAQPGRKELRPVAERLVYRAESKRLDLSISIDLDEKSAPSKATAAGLESPFKGREPILPGQSVSFGIKSRNERGEPIPAIVYAAVADDMLYGQTDDQTDRSLPTHFLLNGEVQSPDSLERADFLLGREPKAKRALDRLLGTQGWRRFAEQNPAEFRNTAKPDDADRLLLAVGTRSPVSSDFKPAVQRVNEQYQSKYDAALTAYETAQANHDAILKSGPVAEKLHHASVDLLTPQKQLQEILTEIRASQSDSGTVLAGLIVYLALALVTAGLFIVRFTVGRSIPERNLILFAAVSLLILLGLLAGLHGYLAWNYERIQQSLPALNEVMVIPTPSGTESAQSEVGKALERISELESEGGKTIVVKPTPNPVDLGNGIVLEADRVVERMRVVTETDSLNDVREKQKKAHKSRIVEAVPGSDTIAASITAQAPFIVREYSHQQKTEPNRTDFTETLYWNPVIVLSDEGTAPWVNFQCSDAIASYRVIVAGHTLDGRLGQTVTQFRVSKPLVASAKLPPEIAWGDQVDLVAGVQSSLSSSMPEIYVRAENAKVLTSNDIEREKMTLSNEGTAKRAVRVSPSTPKPVRVSVWAVDQENHRRDIETRTMNVVPSGYPVSGIATSILDQSATMKVALPANRVAGSLEMSIKAFANPQAELEASLMGLARGPAACFEQTAAKAYPNVLMLQWLESHERTNPAAMGLAQQAREQLPGAYRSLLQFECEKPGQAQREGFEWFGGSAQPHEALTAYGLLQFQDFKRVYAVDLAVLNRTKQFLLSRRDGKGGFTQSRDARDTFGRAPAEIANAYITWALHETDPRLDLKKKPPPSWRARRNRAIRIAWLWPRWFRIKPNRNLCSMRCEASNRKTAASPARLPASPIPPASISSRKRPPSRFSPGYGRVKSMPPASARGCNI
ncbi:MAG: alpha-2-macroglobulin family protein [Gemmataceae bacterium]